MRWAHVTQTQKLQGAFFTGIPGILGSLLQETPTWLPLRFPRLLSKYRL